MHRRDFTAADADVAANDAPVADQFFHNARGELGRDGESDAFRRFAVVALIKRERVNAHQFAQRIHQRAAGVAVIDRGVGLQEVLTPRGVETNAPGGADNPLRDGLPEVIGVAYCHHHIADVRHTLRINRDNRQGGGVDFQHREIGQAVGADQQRLEHAAILQRHDYLVGVVDHMFVGQNIAALVHDNAGAERADFELAAIAAAKAAIIDIHYRRRSATHRPVIAHGGLIVTVEPRLQQRIVRTQGRHERQQQRCYDQPRNHRA
ncbi:hypothetical protein BN135_2884 [Cronobacter muytjensii 530]